MTLTVMRTAARTLKRIEITSHDIERADQTRSPSPTMHVRHESMHGTAADDAMTGTTRQTPSKEIGRQLQNIHESCPRQRL